APPGTGAFRVDAAAVKLRQAPHEREAEAEAPLRAVERAIRLGEEVEDAREQLRSEADAGVSHPKDESVGRWVLGVGRWASGVGRRQVRTQRPTPDARFDLRRQPDPPARLG